MIKGVFPRLFGTFKEGALLHAKFVVTTGGASPVYTLKSTTAGSNYPLTLVGTSSGNQLTLTVPTGGRNLAVLAKDYVNIQNPTTVANYLQIGMRAAIVEGTGVVSMNLLDGVAATLDVSVTGDEIHFTLYVDK